MSGYEKPTGDRQFLKEQLKLIREDLAEVSRRAMAAYSSGIVRYATVTAGYTSGNPTVTFDDDVDDSGPFVMLDGVSVTAGQRIALVLDESDSYLVIGGF